MKNPCATNATLSERPRRTDRAFSRVGVGALDLGDLDVPHAVVVVGGGEGKGQLGGVAAVGANVDVHWRMEAERERERERWKKD